MITPSFDTSHHPDSPCFREHVFEWNGRYWCKGCVASAAGVVLSGFSQLFVGWLSALPEELLGVVFFTLIAPTLLTSLLGASRHVKQIARVLLGFAVGSALMTLFITDRWIVRAAIIIAFFAIRIPLERLRRKQNAAILQQFKKEEPNENRSRKRKQAKQKKRI